MRQEWEPEDLIAGRTLLDPDRELVGNGTGSTRRGFSLLVKFFEVEAWFRRPGGEVPPPVLNHHLGRTAFTGRAGG